MFQRRTRTRPCAALEMTKAEFEKRVNAANTETHDALAEIWNSLNNGQQKKLLKNEKVVAVLKRYGVIE